MIVLPKENAVGTAGILDFFRHVITIKVLNHFRKVFRKVKIHCSVASFFLIHFLHSYTSLSNDIK